ncbi:MAG: hypothetical protein ACI9TH_005134 [Kiritimatiellia bacterium]|jgi:hypothetical protein
MSLKLPSTLWKIATVALLSTLSVSADEFVEDGVLSPANEAIRWHLNRTRAKPEAEADRLNMVNTTSGSNGAYDVAEDTIGANDFGQGPTQWVIWQTPQQPLAPSRLISIACDNHSLDLSNSGAFAHSSPTGNFYPLGSGPFARQEQEGYENEVTGYIENLITSSLGQFGSYPVEAMTPMGAQDSLFIDSSIADRGHRKTMLNADAREVGIGYAKKNFEQTHQGFLLKFVEEYYTYDLGKRGSDHYFTGSIFHDGDANTFYDRGEGLGGIEIRIYQDGVEHDMYDVSSDSGNFAVPLNNLAEGLAMIVFVNPSASPVTLSIPIDHARIGTIQIPAGEQYLLGTFEQVAGDRNVGFRDLMPVTRLDIACHTEQVSISFNSMVGLTYIMQTTNDISSDLNWITLQTLTADEFREAITCGGVGTPLVGSAFFRVLVQQSSLPPGGPL